MMGDGEWETRETALTPNVSYDAYSLSQALYLLSLDGFSESDVVEQIIA